MALAAGLVMQQKACEHVQTRQEASTASPIPFGRAQKRMDNVHRSCSHEHNACYTTENIVTASTNLLLAS